MEVDVYFNQAQYISKQIIQDKTSDEQRDKIDSIESLPNEVLIKIFRELEPHNLVNCSLVSKKWNELSSDKILWIENVKKIEIYDSKDYLQAFCRKIIFLKNTIKEVDPYLHCPQEFDNDSVTSPYVKEVEKGKAVTHSDYIKRGFIAHLLLSRIGLSSFENVKEYARVIVKMNELSNIAAYIGDELEQINKIKTDKRVIKYNPKMLYLQADNFCDHLYFDNKNHDDAVKKVKSSLNFLVYNNTSSLERNANINIFKFYRKKFEGNRNYQLKNFYTACVSIYNENINARRSNSKCEDTLILRNLVIVQILFEKVIELYDRSSK